MGRWLIIWTEQKFIDLESDERTLTDESIAIMILMLTNTKSNLKKELRNFYQTYGKDGVVTYAEARKWISVQNHQRRLTALLLYINGEFNSLLSKLNPEFKSFLIGVIQKESDFFDVELNSDSILEMNWGVDESNWSDRLADDVALWTVYLANDIKRLIIRQATIEDVLSQINKRFISIEGVINKLALTESTAVGSLARQMIFKELGIGKYQFYTKADERTCETCGAIHGNIFPISAYEVGVTASPLHPHCRCWEIPILE